MRSHAGLLWTSVGLLILGVLFFVLSIFGLFWAKPTPLADNGLYAVTIVLLGFGIGGLFLWSAKRHADRVDESAERW